MPQATDFHPLYIRSVHAEHTKSDSSIENAVITSCAKASHHSDSNRRWERGWLPAKKTKPSCHSKAGAAMPSKSHLCLQIANMKHHFSCLPRKQSVVARPVLYILCLVVVFLLEIIVFIITSTVQTLVSSKRFCSCSVHFAPFQTDLFTDFFFMVATDSIHAQAITINGFHFKRCV